jgi:hypothetical protein
MRDDPQRAYNPVPTGLGLSLVPLVGVALGCSADDATSTDASSSKSGGSGGAGTGGETASTSTSGQGAGFVGVGGSSSGAGGACVDTPATPAGAEAQFHPDFQADYRVFDLGPIPGAPPGHLGGSVVRFDDPNTLLFAGDSELASGGLYAIELERGPCGHIVGFKGTATRVADTPYVDANLVYGPSNTLFYTQWPENRISQILPGDSSPASTVIGDAIGIPQFVVDANGNTTGNTSVSGFGFVPPGFSDAGQPRTVTWPAGNWYRLTMSGPGPVFDLSNALPTATLPGGPGGFAYIPAGSPSFPKASLILAEWSVNQVSIFDVDDFGDPVPSSRKEFFSAFPKPWGAYFEPETGDFLFLTWGTLPDRVFVVQGFVEPPPPPDVPR